MQIYTTPLLIYQLWIPREYWSGGWDMGQLWWGRDSLCGTSKGCWRGDHQAQGRVRECFLPGAVSIQKEQKLAESCPFAARVPVSSPLLPQT